MSTFGDARSGWRSPLVQVGTGRPGSQPARANRNRPPLPSTCQGELAAARPLFERALVIWERVLGPDPNHPYVARSLNCLARLLQAQGELAAAQPLFERALVIWERLLGPDHPDTARALNDLALLLQDQGERDAAQLLFDRALAIRERVLGPGHPDTATSRRSLANLVRLNEARGGRELSSE